MTGKREWAASITTAMMSSMGSSTSTTSIWARGTMTSVTRHSEGGQRALDDGQRVGIHQAALVGRVQESYQLFAVPGSRRSSEESRSRNPGFANWGRIHGRVKGRLGGSADIRHS